MSNLKINNIAPSLLEGGQISRFSEFGRKVFVAIIVQTPSPPAGGSEAPEENHLPPAGGEMNYEQNCLNYKYAYC